MEILSVVYSKLKRSMPLWLGAICCSASLSAIAEIRLEQEIPITDRALYFDGVKKRSVDAARNDPDVGPGQYDYMYGPAISPHGDAIKTYKNFVFMTWYKGGKYNRHVMLSRYNMDTGVLKSIEFPHTHTGFQNRWWVGETHNTIAVGISPKNESIHLLYDMHAYSRTKPSDGSLADDYFRYSYSFADAATVDDADFTIDLFTPGVNGDYKHLSMTGQENHNAFSGLTYPRFFLNDEGDLFMHMRKGSAYNGKFVFIKYDGNSTWGNFKDFNVVNATSRGETHNWGIYGVMKYLDGKIRIGFQRRLNNRNDKYIYQNGVYYAYSNNPTGQNSWYNHKDEAITLPVVDADVVKVMEPGDLVSATQKDKISIVGGFDWTVTDSGDVHIIHKVKDNQNNVTVNAHTYQPGGTGDFTTRTDFSGASNIYTSGDRIYIIGLNSEGRPYVEQAEGGTNDFTRVYEGTEGRQFSKGVVHIYDGKLYYYLLERAEGDKRPTYLQIIDLDLDGGGPDGYTFAANERGTVSVNEPSDIAYGANGQFNYLYDQTQNLSCSNATFGDPIPGVSKQCFIKPSDSVPVTVASVSSEQAPNVAENLLDGNRADDSRWSAQGFPQHVVFDLGRSKTVTGTKMWTYADRAYQYRVYVSNSPNSGFVKVADRAGNTASNQPLSTSFSRSGRYVKIEVVGAHNYGNNWVSINEVEIETN